MATGGNKRKAPEGCPQANEEVLKNNLATYFNRHQPGSGYYKRTSEEDRKVASDAQEKYNAMAESDKVEFAKCFLQTKGTKHFQWMKDFTDSLLIKKKSTEGGLEKYTTRSFATKGL